MRQVVARARHLGLGAPDLRLGLPDVFGARSCLQQRELRSRAIAIGRCTAQRQFRVGVVDRRDGRSRRDAVAFVHRQRDEAPSDLGRDLDLDGFDVARRPHAGCRRGRATRWQHGDGDGHECERQ